MGTLKGTLFEGETKCLNKENSRKYEKFMKYLVEIESKNQNENDDLGFEINFGAYLHEPDPKVSEFERISSLYGKRLYRKGKIKRGCFLVAKIKC